MPQIRMIDKHTIFVRILEKYFHSISNIAKALVSQSYEPTRKTLHTGSQKPGPLCLTSFCSFPTCHVFPTLTVVPARGRLLVCSIQGQQNQQKDISQGNIHKNATRSSHSTTSECFSFLKLRRIF